MILALAGGVGGAKCIEGLRQIVEPNTLSVIVNTGDDAEFFGLYVCPDLDTIFYTLAGLVNPDSGWGVRDDTRNTLCMLERYKQEIWFSIGDRDFAAHILRTSMMKQGKSLTEIMEYLCSIFHIEINLLPMTNDKFRTIVHTERGSQPFQEYFVKDKPWIPVYDVTFEGKESAKPTNEVLEVLKNAEGIVFCPSNPVVSINPILQVDGIIELIKYSSVPRIAVSPIVGGKAIKGPAVEMMKGMKLNPSAFGVAQFYKDLIDVIIIDEIDANLKEAIEGLGMKVRVTNTIMHTLKDKIALAEVIKKTLQQSKSK